MPLPPQLYEHLVTAALEALVGGGTGHLEIDPLELADSHDRFARHVAREVERALRAVGGPRDQRVVRQARLVNALLARLRELEAPGPPHDEDVAPPPRVLLSVHDGTPPPRTQLPFSTSTILTRARGEPALGHELAREVATAERLDALVSFVTVGGGGALSASRSRRTPPRGGRSGC